MPACPSRRCRRRWRSWRCPRARSAIEAHKVHRAGFAATKLDVIVNEPPRHRSLAEVLDIVNALRPRSTPTRSASPRSSSALGEVEAEVHGQTLEAVELHEVGAVDALVDVTGAVAGLRLLGIEDVFVSPLPLGHGEIARRARRPAAARARDARAAGARQRADRRRRGAARRARDADRRRAPDDAGPLPAARDAPRDGRLRRRRPRPGGPAQRPARLAGRDRSRRAAACAWSRPTSTT